MVGINTSRVALQNTTATTAPRAEAASSDKRTVEAGSFMLSQSGNVMPGNYGNGPSTPLADPKRFASLEIKALDQHHIGKTTTFQLDERGAPRPSPNQSPLGHVPFQVTLIDHDGQRFSAVVDITRSRIGKTTDGYLDVNNLKLTLEAPAKAPPAEVKLGAFMLTQSGRLMPEGYGNKPVAMFPPGFADHVEVIAMDANRVRNKARFEIDERGMIIPNAKQPALGNVPFQLVATDREGNRYAADVDITPGKVKVSHTGYETLSNVTMKLVVADRAAQALDGVAADFAKQASGPRTGMSPFELMLKR